jgi:hypothetical protein
MADGRKTTDTPEGARDVKSGPRIVLPQIGQLGVYVDPAPLLAPDGSWRRLTNAQFGDMGERTFGRATGAIRKRGGIHPWGGTPLSGGAIMAVGSVPLPSELDLTATLLVGQNDASGSSAAGLAWRSSPDGTTFTNITLASTPRPYVVSSPVLALNNLPPVRVATYRRGVYYGDSNYTRTSPTTDAPPLASYVGDTGYPFTDTPSVGGLFANFVSDFLVVGTTLYYVALHAGLSYVYGVNLLTGTTTWIGDAVAGGYCLASYQGRLWLGVLETVASGLGGVKSIVPGLDTTWRAEFTAATAGRRGVYGLAVFNGELFALHGNYNTLGVAPQIERRTAAGVWSAVLTAPEVNAGQAFAGWAVFNNTLFVGWGKDTATTGARIYSSTTGGTFNIDLNVSSTYALKRPGHPVILNNELYWPCCAFGGGGASATDDFLLKRTAAGVWSRPLTGASLNGAAALSYPGLR